jgi:hypothetical protein
MPANRERLEVPIDLSPLFSALEQPLAFIDAPEKRAELQLYLGGVRLHLERALYECLSRLAEAVDSSDAALGAHLEYRSEGPRLVLELQGEAEAPADGLPFVEGDLEKVTIRLPHDLKETVDRLANQLGLSANSWYIRELARTIARQMRGEDGDGEPPERRPRGNRRSSLKGFVGGA